MGAKPISGRQVPSSAGVFFLANALLETLAQATRRRHIRLWPAFHTGPIGTRGRSAAFIPAIDNQQR